MFVSASFTGGFALMASLIVAVGAQNTFVLRQGLRQEHVGAVVLFCVACDAMLMAAGVAGLGTTLARLPGLLPILTLGGAVFLFWYGVEAARRALQPSTLIADAGLQAASLGRTLRQAAGFTLLNPHVYLDTVLLVGLVGAAQSSGARPSFMAGAALASAGWFTALGFGARLLAPLFRRSATWRWLDALVAATMLFLAANLVYRFWAGTLY